MARCALSTHLCTVQKRKACEAGSVASSPNAVFAAAAIASVWKMSCTHSAQEHAERQSERTETRPRVRAFSVRSLVQTVHADLLLADAHDIVKLPMPVCV